MFPRRDKNRGDWFGKTREWRSILALQAGDLQLWWGHFDQQLEYRFHHIASQVALASIQVGLEVFHGWWWSMQTSHKLNK